MVGYTARKDLYLCIKALEIRREQPPLYGVVVKKDKRF